MTYCQNIRKMVLNYKGNKSNIPNIYNVSRSTYYNWKNKISCSGRKLKITPRIKCYIRSYVIKRKNFNYKLLIKAINRLFSITISKSSIYSILQKNEYN